ncbi:CD80-like immunoglobulin C2-set [Trinorchestia longiramus]|nr:CD80-like immunoglobulin C2-set [Trinorchestia longiramus]
MLLLGFLLPFTLHAELVTPAMGLENSPLTTVHALLGQSALLPCDVTVATASRQPILVLFYYGDRGVPIYSVDARGSNIFKGARWSDADMLDGRASFVVREDKQGLLVRGLTEADAGEYRCRVDFKSSPTKNFRIVLKIIVPPRHLLIMSSWDEGRVVEGTIGPYPRGSDLTLTCQVTGGDPPPAVVWWQAGRLIDRSAELQTPQVTRNSVHLPELGRDDVLHTLTCTASNNNISAPLTASVTVDVALPPTNVRIWLKGREEIPLETEIQDRPRAPSSSTSPRPLVVRENEETFLTCEAHGSRPQAFVIWQKDDRVIDMQDTASTTQFPSHSSHSRERDTGSISTLKFVPTKRDHGKVISCTAYSPKLPDESVVDRIKLHVLYPPQLEVSYNSSTEDSLLEVGDSFSLSCDVDANPLPPSVQWAKDGIPVDDSSLPGVSISGGRLVVRGATRQLSGGYTCAAANTRGSSTSPPLTLKIKFAPECAVSQKSHYGAGLKEVIEVTCRVLSYPPPLSYRWALNTSTGVIDVPQNTFSSNGTVSRVMYIAHTHTDFGRLSCWAANDVGLMVEPCVFYVVPAAKPEAVENCRVHNNSSMPRTIALVTCTPGYDGGMNQTFALEVRELHNPHSPPLAQVSHSPIPVFHLNNLKLGEPVIFTITAVNARGNSPSVSLTYTPPHMALGRRAPNAYDSSNTTWIPWTIFITIIFGGLTTALVCFCGALFFLKFRTPRKTKSGARMVYAGPVRASEKEHLNGALDRQQTHCDSVDCEEKQLLKVDFIPVSPNSSPRSKQPQEGDIPPSRHMAQPRLDILPHDEDGSFNNPTSDVRYVSPNTWGTPCCGEVCQHSYGRSSLSSPSPSPHHSNSSPLSPSPSSPKCSPRFPTASPRLCPNQLNPNQLNPTQLNPTQLNPNQLNPTELNPTQLNPTQLNPTQLNPTELNFNQMNPTEMNPTEVNPTEMNPTELNLNQLNPNQLPLREACCMVPHSHLCLHAQ